MIKLDMTTIELVETLEQYIHQWYLGYKKNDKKIMKKWSDKYQLLFFGEK